MAQLELETTRNGPVAVVAPTGELDLSGAAVLQAELDRLADEGELGGVVLDLRGLEFMDSSGLRLVVLADMQAREAGRRFALVRGDETVHRVFEITRMSDRLQFVNDPEAASAARHALDDLGDAMSDARLRDVRLLVSEVVTNAVRHADLAAGDAIELVVELNGGALRVEVHDPGGGFVPTAPAPDPTRPSGWGLYLVAELADRWGVDSDETTLVWFEFDRPAAAA
jgi:anti-anti-sigma factor